MMLSISTVYAENSELIESQIAQNTQRIEILNNEVAALNAEKHSISEQIILLDSDLKAASEQLDYVRVQAETTKTELENAMAAKETAYDTFADRLVSMYETGAMQYADMLLSSDSISELLKRTEYIQEIIENDRDIFDNMSGIYTSIEEKSTLLQQQQVDLEAKTADFNTRIGAYNTRVYEINAEIEEKKKQKEQLQKEIEDLNKSLSSVDYAEALFSEAEKYIGMPYVWGGSTPQTSFDCSGFVCWSVTKSGVKNLPRTTAQGIYDQCIKISPSEAKRGDIIFFQGTYDSGSPVTHVGFYAGDGKMLHCGNPIQYTSTKTAYWTSHFYAYGRLK